MGWGRGSERAHRAGDQGAGAWDSEERCFNNVCGTDGTGFSDWWSVDVTNCPLRDARDSVPSLS
jgi:hypothetical protein